MPLRVGVEGGAGIHAWEWGVKAGAIILDWVSGI